MTDQQVGVLLLLVGVVGIVVLVLYIRAIVNAANSDRWGWVILMLVIWPVFIFYRRRPRAEDYRREFSADRREPTIRE